MGSLTSAPTRVPPLPADATTAGAVNMTKFINNNSHVKETALPVPARPRDVKAVASLLAKLRIASTGACSSTSFGDAFQKSLGNRGGAGGTSFRVEFAPPAPRGSGSETAPSDAADTVWFMGGSKPLVVFCASRSEAGDGRTLTEIDFSSPVLMWTVDALPRARRTIGRLWGCCEEGAGGDVKPAAEDAFDDLGSDYEEQLNVALSSSVNLVTKEREEKVASIRAAYCAAHGLPTAPSGAAAADADKPEKNSHRLGASGSGTLVGSVRRAPPSV